MLPTSPSLLERLRRRPDAASWKRLHDLYRPLFRQWLGRVPGLRDEVDDLAQEVLEIVVRELPGFERRREGSFRAWLRAITVNRVRKHWRNTRGRPQPTSADAEQFLAGLEDPAGEVSRRWDLEHDRQVLERLLELVRGEFTAATWSTFERNVVDGLPAARVAREIGVSENAVLLAKSRVLRRLREEAAGLVDG
jgi:RNA polymerase sigma-70 factor (ECF subfamily)